MTPIARAAAQPRAQAWFFGMASVAAAAAGLAVVSAAPPLFLAMTALLLACQYGLVMLREPRLLTAQASLLLAFGWLLLAAWPLYTPLSSSSSPLVVVLLAGCAGLRLARWRRAGSGMPMAAIGAGGFAALAGLALASNPHAGAFGAATAAQIELLAGGADWLVLAWGGRSSRSSGGAAQRPPATIAEVA